MNNLQFNQNLRYMRYKKATWISSIIFYKLNKKEILVKNFTKMFGKQLHLRKSKINKKVLIYNPTLEFWYKNDKNSMERFRNNMDYINKNKFFFIFLKKQPRRFFRLLYSRKVRIRYFDNYKKFSKNLDTLLKYKIIFTLLSNIFYKNYYKNINKPLKYQKTLNNFFFFLKETLKFHSKYFFLIKINKHYYTQQLTFQFKLNNKENKEQLKKIKLKFNKHNVYILGLLFFVKKDILEEKKRKKKNYKKYRKNNFKHPTTNKK